MNDLFQNSRFRHKVFDASRPRHSPFGTPLHIYSSIDSTNRVAHEYATHNLPHGSTFVTDFQSKGRGRQGKSWIAPPNTGLLFSLFLHPKPLTWPAEKANWLTMMAGLSVVNAATSLHEFSPKLKWPNDLIVEKEGIWHKWGGIITEAQFDQNHLQSAIIGIGLNVNMQTTDLPKTTPPSTSLLLETADCAISREKLLAYILDAFTDEWERAEQGKSPHQRWHSFLAGIGESVTVSGEQGVFQGVDEWGRLLLQKPTGETQKFSAGDVSLRQLRPTQH